MRRLEESEVPEAPEVRRRRRLFEDMESEVPEAQGLEEQAPEVRLEESEAPEVRRLVGEFAYGLQQVLVAPLLLP